MLAQLSESLVGWLVKRVGQRKGERRRGRVGALLLFAGESRVGGSGDCCATSGHEDSSSRVRRWIRDVGLQVARQ